MLFNSLHFLIFFPVITVAYFLFPTRSRNFLLLAASCYFYMAFLPAYILVLASIILVDYAAALQIEKAQGKVRLGWLSASLVANLGALAFFKYSPLAAQLIEMTTPWKAPDFLTKVILPLGLSFHTFQALSYTLEVFRGKQVAERSLLHYALYVMFFPQLVAGPIERPGHLLPQFWETHSFDPQGATEGLRRILWGLFKKMVVADHLSTLVDRIYGNPQAFGGPLMALATVFFAVQIYCDFSGYSDIAIGSARILGFRLMENFRDPYRAESLREFWHRWHISLSTWFRDYLYIPLGGGRAGSLPHARNLFLTFLVSGLWHGANLTFLVWGALHGLFFLAEHWTSDFRKNSLGPWLGNWPGLHRYLRTAGVFALTCFAWIFFRARDLNDALYIAGHLFIPTRPLGDQLAHLPWDPAGWVLAVLLSGWILGLQWWGRDEAPSSWLSSRPTLLRWGSYHLLAGSVLAAFLISGLSSKQFIYFQF